MVKVIDQYEKALVLQPDLDRNQLSVLNLPQIREAGEEYERALGLFETAAGFRPEMQRSFIMQRVCMREKTSFNNQSPGLRSLQKWDLRTRGFLIWTRIFKT